MCLARERPKNSTLSARQPPLSQLDPAADFLGKLPVMSGNYQAYLVLFVKPKQQFLNLFADRKSSEPVGSSAKTSFGFRITARATATRCCSPPESLPGR